MKTKAPIERLPAKKLLIEKKSNKIVPKDIINPCPVFIQRKKFQSLKVANFVFKLIFENLDFITDSFPKYLIVSIFENISLIVDFSMSSWAFNFKFGSC